LLERLFLSNGRTLIDMELGESMLRFQIEQVIFNMFQVMRHWNENPQCYRVDVVEDLVEKVSQNKSPMLSIEIEEEGQEGGIEERAT
jgi:hypothetical protein